MFVALGVTLVLVAGLGVSGWLYFTGRFGFGPLSAADKDAAATISDEVGVPEWADDDQIECSVDDLVKDARSKGLEENGLIDRKGDDWEYTEKWQADDASAYFEGILDCSDDWADQVGEMWKLDDTDCLDDIGAKTIGNYFAAELLTLADEDDDSLTDDRDEAVKELDSCYAQDPPTPSAEAKPAYRGVKFTVSVPDDAPDDVTFSSNESGSFSEISGSSVKIDTDEGGEQGCVTVQAKVTYPWGTTREAQEEFCGKAKPKRVWWQREKKCASATISNCMTWRLRAEGFKSYSFLTVRYTHNGGDCMAVSGGCTDTGFVNDKGRATFGTWSFPQSYSGQFRGIIDGMRAKIPN